MLEHSKLEQLAYVSVARGSGFAGLAIISVMVGLSDHMASSLKAGGILAIFACLVLLMKAVYVFKRSHRRTELWVMLDPEDRPHESIAQRVICTALRGMYFKFARQFAVVSVAMLLGSLVLSSLPGPLFAKWEPPRSEPVRSGWDPAKAPTHPFRLIP